MSLRDSLEIALLLAVGTVLRLVVPGYGAGMKPDFALTMLFIIILMKPHMRTTILAGILAGILAALTTTFPAGQVPNLVDKLLTSLVVLAMAKGLLGRVPIGVACGVVGAVGTVFSGTVFLTTALLLTGLPAPFGVLFGGVVLPAAVINTVTILVLYPIVNYSKKALRSAKA